MDEIELLVAETFRHFHENFEQTEANSSSPLSNGQIEEREELPEGPGVIYHIQKSTSVFVVRTFVSMNIGHDFQKILKRPEDYPSLRLLENGTEDLGNKLKFFLVENPSEAEIIHDQLHNRRFPMFEEMMCNLSDPGFSWWLTKKPSGFQISFTMSVSEDGNTIKLGPLGDRELALRNFQSFEGLVTSAGLEMNIQNELNRVQFSDCEEFLLEELKDVFEFGVVTDTLKDLFKILARKGANSSRLEEAWFYLHELAAMRRFWIQIQFDLNADQCRDVF